MFPYKLNQLQENFNLYHAYSQTSMFDSGKIKIDPHYLKRPSFIPSQPTNEISTKAKLFSALIAFDLKVDTTDIYSQNWATDY